VPPNVFFTEKIHCQNENEIVINNSAKKSEEDPKIRENKHNEFEMHSTDMSHYRNFDIGCICLSGALRSTAQLGLEPFADRWGAGPRPPGESGEQGGPLQPLFLQPSQGHLRLQAEQNGEFRFRYRS